MDAKITAEGLRLEYPEADFSRIETLKQIVINKFKQNELPLLKIRKGKIDGIWVYHIYGNKCSYSKRELLAVKENKYIYRRYRKIYWCSFISTENLEDFCTFLNLALVEAKIRKENV